MANIIFSGENSSINIGSGVTEVIVDQDLYSAWKNWCQEDTNMRWLNAFRTVGGDPTASGQFSPKYFFLMNGWRVYVDGSITPALEFALNLYVDEGGSPFVLSNNATVSNTRSDVAVVSSEVSEILDYAGVIVYDEVDGVAGSTYPTGTRYQPVNNPADLKLLQDTLDISEVLLRSDMNCDSTTFAHTLFKSNTSSYYVNFIGEQHAFEDCFFERLRLSGDVAHSTIVAQDCAVFDVDHVSGIMDNCHFMGNILIASGSNLNTSHCVSGIPGSESPAIDMNAGHTTTLSVRDYSGGLKIYNADQTGDTATLEYVAGKAHLLTGNTDGYISVRGVAVLNDQSSGTTIDTTGLWYPEEQSLKLSEILGLSQSNYKISGQGYDDNDNMTGATIETFASATDLGAGTPVAFTYIVTASYDGNGNMDDYNVSKG